MFFFLVNTHQVMIIPTMMSILILLVIVMTTTAKTSSRTSLDSVKNVKDFKKVLRTRNNILLLFTNDENETADLVNTLVEVLKGVRGEATILTVSCADKDGGKICKKMKISNEKQFRLKHFLNGAFHKDYDRSFRQESITAFLQDPTGDLPWQEEAGQNIVHIKTSPHLSKLLKARQGEVLVMFHSPWCQACKTMKPVLQEVAEEFAGKVAVAAADTSNKKNVPLIKEYNVSALPTLLYFKEGRFMFPYEGGRTTNVSGIMQVTN